MLRKMFFYLIVLGLLLGSLLAAAVYFSIEEEPLVRVTSNPSADEMQQVRDIITSNKPADILSSSKKKLVLTQSQTNLLLQYGNEKFSNSLRAKTIFDNNRTYLELSYKLPNNPIGSYINIRTTVRVQYAKYFVIEELKIGKMAVPAILASLIQPYIIDKLRQRYGAYYKLWGAVKRIDIYQSKMTVHYQLKRSDLRNIKKVAEKILVTDVMRERILAYADEMSSALNQLDGSSQTVINLLSPMFAFAEQRTAKNQQAVEENRILLLTLGAYMVSKSPAKYISKERRENLRKITFTLNGRHDLAQHYLVSAALNALSGTQWSNAVGLQKELKDSDGGSGFSFIDLMADIAGNKMAAMAMSDKTANTLQDRLKLIGSEDEIIGGVSGLVENLSKDEFRIEFGSVGSEEYIRVVRDIERRLFSCSVYRP